MKEVSRREAVSRLVTGGTGLAFVALTGAEAAGAVEGGTAAAQGQPPAGAPAQAI